MVSLLTSKSAVFMAFSLLVVGCISIFIIALEVGSGDVPVIVAADTVIDVKKGAVNLVFIQQFSDCQSYVNEDLSEDFDESLCNVTISLLKDVCINTNEDHGIKFVCTAIFSRVGDDSGSNSGNTRINNSLKSSLANIVHTSFEIPQIFLYEKGLTEGNIISLLCNSWLKSSQGCGDIDRYINILYSNDIIFSNAHDVLDFIMAINPLHTPLLIEPSKMQPSYANGPGFGVDSVKKYFLQYLEKHKQDLSKEKKLMLTAAIGYDAEDENLNLVKSEINEVVLQNAVELYGRLPYDFSEVSRQFNNAKKNNIPRDSDESAPDCDGILSRNSSRLLEMLRASLDQRGYLATSGVYFDSFEKMKISTTTTTTTPITATATTLESEKSMPRRVGIEEEEEAGRARRISKVEDEDHVRLLCLTYTIEANHASIKSILKTWGRNCDGYLAFSNVPDSSINVFSFEDHKDEYTNIWRKVTLIWQLIASSNLLDDFDYFFMGGDDIFLIVDNLREYLASITSNSSRGDGKWNKKFAYLGRPFYHNAITRFNSGGAGYVLDRNSLLVLIYLMQTPPYSNICLTDTQTSMEDVLIGRCLALAGIYPADTTIESRDRNRMNSSSSSSSSSCDSCRDKEHIFHPTNFSETYEGTNPWYGDVMAYSASISSISSSLSDNLVYAALDNSKGSSYKHSFSEESVSFQSIKTPDEMRCIYSRLYSPLALPSSLLSPITSVTSVTSVNESNAYSSRSRSVTLSIKEIYRPHGTIQLDLNGVKYPFKVGDSFSSLSSLVKGISRFCEFYSVDLFSYRSEVDIQRQCIPFILGEFLQYDYTYDSEDNVKMSTSTQINYYSSSPQSQLEPRPPIPYKMIIDCFIFYNEIDLLIYRLNLLYEVVDYFVIVEATKTFTDKDKDLHYEQNEHLFAKFKDKIVHVVVTKFPYEESSSTAGEVVVKILEDQVWLNEFYQRDAIQAGISLINMTDNDLLVIGDADEIPDPRVLTKCKTGKIEVGVNTLEMDFYYYNLETLHKDKHIKPKIISYKNYKDLDTTMTVIRNLNCPVIEDGGWHLSYFGDLDFIRNKINHFSHQEFNTDEFTDTERMKNRIESATDLFDRPDIMLAKVSTRDNRDRLPPGFEKYLNKYYSD